MVDNFIVIHLIFAEIFVTQDFTIRAGHGFMGPANTCAMHIKTDFEQKSSIRETLNISMCRNSSTTKKKSKVLRIVALIPKKF